MSNSKIGVLEFLKENSGAFTALGLFLIFVYQVFPVVRTSVRFESTMVYIWFFSYLIAIIITFSITHKGFSRELKSTFALSMLNTFLIIIAFIMVLDFMFNAILEKNIENLIVSFPNNLAPTLIMTCGMIIPVYMWKHFKKRKSKISKLLFIVLPILFLIVYPFFVNPLNDDIITLLKSSKFLNNLTLFYLSFAFSSIFVIFEVLSIFFKKKKK